ncbi:regulator of cell morphogenesis and NO signaling [Cricetibacter osteomyelitidis]|uniref:Regulator of cell morphogenesis and NO signaling n=1 Tax=Cricetibacter osteomyelitidis TaxID=1521931 RepID=A0A4R2TRJ9_9PAST|nr:hemerythrin domain-containing protein [Cricetibacter osteomyelitidis]TCP97662.1 regulator of cell morphogenesis and NO signaling [Cricetibacter osteomyelitidis]
MVFLSDNELNSLPYNQIIESYILPRFHQRHREQLAELIVLAEKVERVHADRPDAPIGLHAELQNILADLTSHMMKEEQILFPMINAGQYQMAAMPIRVMNMEHEEHADHIEVLKSLTNNMTPPADACGSWQALYNGVAEFINDLNNHIHTEDDILFQRVLKET